MAFMIVVHRVWSDTGVPSESPLSRAITRALLRISPKKTKHAVSRSGIDCATV
jgi:hypothetical protein